MARQDLALNLNQAQPWRIISMDTVRVSLVAFIAVALVQTASIVAGDARALAAAAAAAWGGIAIELAAASYIIYVAGLLPERDARRTWRLLGLAVLCAAIWDADWTYHQGQPLASSNTWEVAVLQVLLVIAFILSVSACIRYALHFHGRADILVAALVTAGVLAVIGVVAWFVVLRPGLLVTRLSSKESLGYLSVSVSNLVFSFTPVLLVLTTVSQVRSPLGNLPDWARVGPWAVVQTSTALTTVSSMGWYYRLEVAPWAPGLLLDFFYLMGYALLVTAVMLEHDRQSTFLGARASGVPLVED